MEENIYRAIPGFGGEEDGLQHGKHFNKLCMKLRNYFVERALSKFTCDSLKVN